MLQSRSALGFIVIGIALFFAIWLGISIVTDQIQTLAYVAIGSTLIICAALGRRIWMIIPFFSALNLTLMVPGQPTTTMVAQGLFVGFCGLLFMMRRLPLKIRFTELEFWTLLITLCVGQAYLRNPVGLNILGAGSVGGRPYAIFGAALITSLLLGSLRVPAADLRWILRLSIIGGLLNFVSLAVGFFVPQLGMWIGSVNANATNTSFQEGAYGVDRSTRIGFLGQLSNNLALWISSFKSPIRACFHPIWAPLVVLTFAFAALSGFRNEIGMVGLIYLVGIAYRGGIPSVLVASMALLAGITLLAFINVISPLPSNMQRSLSFFPGTWEKSVVQDAKSSTEWRTDMWEEALFTEFWIQNKWLGDGLGMTRGELNYIQSFGGNMTDAQSIRGSGVLSLQQEMMMASNNYHSGPISTIRTIGYLGLIILLIAKIRLAIYAHRIIKQMRTTSWYPHALFVGIPLIINPFFWVFIFGSFGGGVAMYLGGAAFIRLLENNFPAPSSLTQKE